MQVNHSQLLIYTLDLSQQSLLKEVPFPSPQKRPFHLIAFKQILCGILHEYPAYLENVTPVYNIMSSYLSPRGNVQLSSPLFLKLAALDE